MLSKLSVRKPYTVAVFVALVLILGFRSLTMMKTDLLPEMGLPYAVVATTCQGYNPETAESVVTKPIEQAMATVSNIKNISSTSAENMSVVILEFATDTDMDSVSLEIREKLDQISGYWDDSVSKPMIMKINPDMLPIMVAAVDVEGKDSSELTDYVESNISPDIESIAGVASVSVAGTVTESISVTIDEERLKAVNELVEAAIREEFEEKTQALDDAEKELENGQKLLEEGKGQLEDGQKQVTDGKKKLADGIAEGQQGLSEAQAKINSGSDEIDTQLQALELKQSELTSGKAQLTQTQTTLTTILDETKKARDNLQKLMDLRDTLKENEESSKSLLEQARQMLANLFSGEETVLEPETPAMTYSETEASALDEDEIVADEGDDSELTASSIEEETIAAASIDSVDVPEVNTDEIIAAASINSVDVPEVNTDETIAAASADSVGISATDEEEIVAAASDEISDDLEFDDSLETDLPEENSEESLSKENVVWEDVIVDEDKSEPVSDDMGISSGETVLSKEGQKGELSASAETEGFDLGQYLNPNQNASVSAQVLQERIKALQASYEQMKANREAAQEQIRVYIESLGLSDMDEKTVLATLDEQISTMETTLTDLSAKAKALDEAQTQLNAGKEELQKAKTQIQSGQSQIISGQSQLTTQQILATIEMSVGEAKLANAQAQVSEKEATLNSAREQLDAQREQADEALQSALDAGNLENLITRELIAGILVGENFSMPAGYLTEGKNSWLVRVGDKVTDSHQLEDLVLLDLNLDGLDPICLKDVAVVTRMDNSKEVYSKLNGEPAVQLTIQKQTGYSTGEVTKKLKKRMEEISSENDKIHFSIIMDQGIYIDLVVNSVISNMLSGAVLAILILLIFLRDVRSTIIIACSIPFSVVAAFVMMFFSGITLNVISLSGLALGIGMLVDNSIVVIENIDRLRKEGTPPRLAAVKGASGVSGAIVASTLTTVCVFAPIVFAEGITKQLFVDMGLTIAYSLGASLIVALTLVPAMSAALIRKKKKQRPDRIMDAVKNFYGRLLGIILRVKWLVLLAVVGLLVLSAYLVYQKGTAFLPNMESTQATITVTGPQGSTFEDLKVLTDEVVERIIDIPDIEEIGASAGGNSGNVMGMLDSSGSDSATIYLVLKEEGREMNSLQLQAEIEKRVEGVDAEVEVVTQSMDSSSMGSSGIQVQILGRDLDTITELADKAAEIIETVPGVINVDSGKGERSSEFRISVNKAKAMEYKLTVAQVFQAVYERLAKSNASTTLSGEEKDYDVFVQDERDQTLTRELLENMPITYTDSENKEQKVLLSEIAEFSEAAGPNVIKRENQSRFMQVSAEVDQDHNIGLVSNEVNSRLEKELKLPGGYTYKMTGEDATINDAMKQLLLMMAMAVCLIYFIMVAQFQSLLSPFIIMFTLPLAFTGGFLGLFLADMELSVIAMIGFVVLAGIIVNNGIVLVDYTNELRAGGMGKKEALIKAGKDRLRPIIMTALTTILGLSVSAAGVGMGSDMIQPMAVVTIGGLIYGTLLTLLVVPCLYDLLNREKYKTYELEDEMETDEEQENL